MRKGFLLCPALAAPTSPSTLPLGADLTPLSMRLSRPLHFVRKPPRSTPLTLSQPPLPRATPPPSGRGMVAATEAMMGGAGALGRAQALRPEGSPPLSHHEELMRAAQANKTAVSGAPSLTFFDLL